MKLHFNKMLRFTSNIPSNIKRLWSGRKWSNRFYHYLFSYVFLVVVLLLGVSGVVYGSFLNVLQQEVEESTIATLSQVKDAMDTRINEMDRMALQISTNPLLTPFAATENGYGMFQAVRELKKHRSTNSFIYDIMLHYHHRDPALLYSASGTYESAPYFSRVYGLGMDENQGGDFITLLASTDSSGLRSVGHIKGDDPYAGELVTYIYPLSRTSTGYGTLFFLFREQDLNRMIQNVLKDYTGAIYILNEQGEQVTQVLNQTTDEKSQNILEAVNQRNGEGSETIRTVSIDREPYSIVQLTSEHNGWSYISAMPTRQLLSKVNDTRRIFQYAVMAVFLLGLFIAFALAIRNYRPILKLTGTLRDSRLREALPKKTDELAFIAEAIGKVTRENEGLLEKLKGQAGIIKENHVTAIVEGKIRTLPELEVMLTVPDPDFKLDEKHYAVMLFLIDDYDQFKQENTHSMQDIVRYSLSKVVENLSMEIGAGYAVNYMNGRGVVTLLNIREGCQKQALLNTIATEAKKFFKQTYRFSVTAGIGGIYSDFSKVHQSYSEADYAARYRLVKGGNQVISYSEINRDKEGILWYPLETEKQLVKAIKQGNGDDVEQAIRMMISGIASQSISIEKIEFICFDIINTVMKTLVEMDIPPDGYDASVEKLFVPHLETMEELEHQMVGFCHQVCRYVNDHKESKNHVLLEQLVAYVDKNYSEPGINLDRIAEEFGFSASYLTRFFKNQTGHSLMRYIDDIRMEKARKLLKETDQTLGDMIKEIGYTDTTNFIRKFKKLEGVTPIQYRNLVRGSSLSISK